MPRAPSHVRRARRLRSGDGADGVDEQLAADRDAGAGAARPRGAADSGRERHAAPRHPVAAGHAAHAAALRPWSRD